jgi:DNA helicase-2/ATP-dependent DNA helicase PcrA
MNDEVSQTERAETPPRGRALLSSLSDVQRRAASHRDGPLVVFAGAGSGKTRIITHRIAWLIEQGVYPWEILAVTFTNKAAQEMKVRVDALSPYASRSLIATFHSACARWLREFAPFLGFTSDFTIYDDDDSLAAIKTIMNELNVKLDGEVTPNEYKTAIGRCKTRGLLPGDPQLTGGLSDMLPPVGVQIYQRYQEYLQACNAMDFGDLIMNMVLLFRRNEEVRTTLQKRYKYVLVDEYQDINQSQFELIKTIVDKHRNIFVVGDDDQSIYSWRGAVPSNIINFDKMYRDAVKITMEQNYRCSGTIVRAAGAMIANNKYRVPKEPFTDNELGDPINYRLEADNEIEAWWVIESLKSERHRFGYSDTAVFYRTNSQSRMLEDALRRENIPYQIYGTVRFYDRMEIKDLMAYLRVLVNPADDVSVRRILNVPPRGLGNKAEETIESEAIRRGVPLLKAVEAMAAESYPKVGPKLYGFVATLQALRQELLSEEASIDAVLETLLERTGYIEYVTKKFPDQAQDKIENIHELGAALADFAGAYPDATLSDWLQSVTLSSSEGESQTGVTLMTLHMAKGLEFPRVYIVGLEENLLPHKNSLDDPESLEEERRLFYVGMTRAKERLSLAGAYRRRTYNNWSANQPSRFLTEIPAELFKTDTEVERVLGRHAGLVGEPDGPQYDYGDPDGLGRPPTVGESVNHPTYGRGTVEELVDEFGVPKAVVRFAEFGLRKVMLAHLSD